MIGAPKTQAEADALVYNKWAGRPQGTRMTGSIFLVEGATDHGKGLMLRWVVVACDAAQAKSLIEYPDAGIDEVTRLGSADNQTPRVVCSEEP